jgi:hypothetical protein
VVRAWAKPDSVPLSPPITMGTSPLAGSVRKENEDEISAPEATDTAK